METNDREILWRQFGAAIDMFGNAVRDCPDALWEANLWEVQGSKWAPDAFSAFWYVSFHTLFWLDLYLSGSAEENFAPPAPFDLTEMEENGRLPRVYTRAELLTYFAYCRQKCHDTILALTNEQAYRPCRYPWGEVPYMELQLYNLRHVQEHGAQLRLFLGQQANRPARWETKAL